MTSSHCAAPVKVRPVAGRPPSLFKENEMEIQKLRLNTHGRFVAQVDGEYRVLTPRLSMEKKYKNYFLGLQAENNRLRQKLYEIATNELGSALTEWKKRNNHPASKFKRQVAYWRQIIDEYKLRNSEQALKGE